MSLQRELRGNGGLFIAAVITVKNLLHPIEQRLGNKFLLLTLDNIAIQKLMLHSHANFKMRPYHSPRCGQEVYIIKKSFYACFLYVIAARMLKTKANTPNAAKFDHNSARAVPFKYTERKISIK